MTMQKSHTAWQDIHASLNTLEAALHDVQKSKRNDARKEQLLKQMDSTIAALEKLMEKLHGNGQSHGQ